MKLTFHLLLSAILTFVCHLDASAHVLSALIKDKLAVEQSQKLSEAENRIENFSSKKKAKLKKRMTKVQEKVNTKLAKRAAKGQQYEEDREISGVGLGLIIVLVGALVAVLGLAGVADILITIGLVVLILGLIFWLLD